MSEIKQVAKLAKHSLHLWHIHLPDFFDFDSSDNLLNSEEKSRKNRYIFEKHQIRFGTCRKLVRVILGHYLSKHPEQLIFLERLKGKPCIEDDPIFFNVSNTSDYMALAIHPSKEIGVDIETIKQRDFVGLAQHSFSMAETAVVRQTDLENRADIFYRIWSQKEAFIKQNGQGLSYPLADFTVDEKSSGGLISVQGENHLDYVIKTYLAHPGIQAAYCSKDLKLEPAHFTNSDLEEIL